jgi:hypothetical protein
VAQPAKAVQRRLPFHVRRLEQEGRLAAGVDDMAFERVAGVIDLDGDLRIGQPEIGRRDQHAFGRAAAEAPAIDRPRAQAPTHPPPQLGGDQRRFAADIRPHQRQAAIPPHRPERCCPVRRV